MAVIIRGAGDIATGIALRLHRAGFQIIMTDLPQPTSIRRTVCFSEALRLGEVLVEDVRARRTDSAREALGIAGTGEIAVVADPTCALLPELYPAALVDAILAKRNLGTSRDMAPVVIGVGPGFTAGEDCHAAVETMRGHTLGRVLYRGAPIPNTGIPGKSGPGGGAGGRRSHALHHRRLSAGSAAGRAHGTPGHEVRRHRPSVQAGSLLPGLGQGSGRGRRSAGVAASLRMQAGYAPE